MFGELIGKLKCRLGHHVWGRWHSTLYSRVRADERNGRMMRSCRRCPVKEYGS